MLTTPETIMPSLMQVEEVVADAVSTETEPTLEVIGSPDGENIMGELIGNEGSTIAETIAPPRDEEAAANSAAENPAIEETDEATHHKFQDNILNAADVVEEHTAESIINQETSTSKIQDASGDDIAQQAQDNEPNNSQQEEQNCMTEPGIMELISTVGSVGLAAVTPDTESEMTEARLRLSEPFIQKATPLHPAYLDTELYNKAKRLAILTPRKTYIIAATKKPPPQQPEKTNKAVSSKRKALKTPPSSSTQSKKQKIATSATAKPNKMGKTETLAAVKQNKKQKIATSATFKSNKKQQFHPTKKNIVSKKPTDQATAPKKLRFTTVHTTSKGAGLPLVPPTEDIGRPWPKGWKKRGVPRQDGSQHIDKYFFTPKNEFELRSLKQVRLFLETLEKVGGDEEKALIVMGGAK